MQIDRPQPGYFRTRLRSKGPWAPAIIWLDPARDPDTGQAMDRAPTLRCIVNGEERSPYEAWTNLHPIDEAAYRRLCREREGVDDAIDINHSPVRI